MDEQQFAQYVITLAFQSLHPIYPEWYDGLTFNAHLANYLRQINTKRRTVDLKTEHLRGLFINEESREYEVLRHLLYHSS